MIAAEFSTAKCYFILILLPLASESNSLNKIKENKKKKKKLIQKYSKESIYLSTKKKYGRKRAPQAALTIVLLCSREAKCYKDENVRTNHSDKRLILAVISASFSKNEVELEMKIETSCLSASKHR